MWTELDYQTFGQPIVRNNSELGVEILKSRINDASGRHISKRWATINNHCGSTMMSNRLSEGHREPMKQKVGSKETVAEYIAARKWVKRIVKQKNAIKN